MAGIINSHSRHILPSWSCVIFHYRGIHLMALELILPIKTPSRNELDRTNHWVRKRSKKDIAWLIAVAGGTDDQYKALWKEVRSIKIVSYRRFKLDWDGLVGGFKDLIDVLEDIGLVFNDNSTYLIHKMHEQIRVKTKKEERMHIFLDIIKKGGD